MTAMPHRAILVALLMTSVAFVGCTAPAAPADKANETNKNASAAGALDPVGREGAAGGSASGSSTCGTGPLAGLASPTFSSPNTRAALAALRAELGPFGREGVASANTAELIAASDAMEAAVSKDMLALDLSGGMDLDTMTPASCAPGDAPGSQMDSRSQAALITDAEATMLELEARADQAEEARSLRLARLDASLARADARRALDALLEYQGEQFGVTPVTLRTIESGSPSVALRAFFAQQDVTPTADDTVNIRQLDSIGEPVRDRLTRFIDALTVLGRVLQEYESADPRSLDAALDQALTMTEGAQARAMSPRSAPADILQDAGVDLSRMLAARRAVVLAATDLTEALQAPGVVESLASLEIIGSAAGTTSGGREGGCKVWNWDGWIPGLPNTYTDDFIVSVDVGGSDTYHNNAGGNTCGSECEWVIVAAAVDVGGSDTYGDGSRGCGVVGGAIGYTGVGILMDDIGSDTYDAGGKGTIGGGFGGLALGLVADFGGADIYKGGSFGVNGGGSGLSAGFQFDFGQSADSYKAGSSATNGGGDLAGVGLHYDAGGADTYVANGVAVNGGGAFAGAGFLFNGGSGSDSYTAGNVAANGGGMLLGIGILSDDGGQDSYNAGWGATNGGAVGLILPLPLPGFGFIFDKGMGNDAYTASYGAVNGGGANLGFGHIKDHGGDDTYVADAIATNGGAILLSTGKINDLLDGEDMYVASSIGSNGGGILVALGRILDHGGSDRYVASFVAANGGGFLFGWGRIQDDGGNDIYSASSTGANGGGALGGWGRIIDKGGDDTYMGASCGVNGGACLGGNGTIYDWGGADNYSAMALGVNGGGWMPLPPGVVEFVLGPLNAFHGSIDLLPNVADFLVDRVYAKGLLFDLGGNDHYSALTADTYGANGGGAWWGVGHLRDEGGADVYFAGDVRKPGEGNCGVNGGACWFGDGDLTDLGCSDDTYQAGSRGTNGGTFNTEQQGTLIDQHGSDHYTAGSKGTNGGAAWSTPLTDDMGMAKLLDLGGRGDSYTDSGGTGIDLTILGKPGNRHGDQFDVNGECVQTDFPLPDGNDTDTDDDNVTPVITFPTFPFAAKYKKADVGDALVESVHMSWRSAATTMVKRVAGVDEAEGDNLERAMIQWLVCPEPLPPHFCGRSGDYPRDIAVTGFGTDHLARSGSSDGTQARNSGNVSEATSNTTRPDGTASSNAQAPAPSPSTAPASGGNGGGNATSTGGSNPMSPGGAGSPGG